MTDDYTEDDIRELAEEYRERIDDEVIENSDYTEEEIIDEISNKINRLAELKVQRSEWRVMSAIADDLGYESESEILEESGQGGTEEVTIREIEEYFVENDAEDEDDLWVDIEVRFEQDWDPFNEDMFAQAGLIVDETGSMKLQSWATSDPMTLEEGKSYRLESAKAQVYNDDYTLYINSSTEITELDEEVDDPSRTIQGNLVMVRDDEGLIRRCPEDGCYRVVGRDETCDEHGEVDSEFDLRLVGVVDDGQTFHRVYLDDELTTKITGITLDDAIEIAQDTLDETRVLEQMKDVILHRYFRFHGRGDQERFLVNDVEKLTGTPDVDGIMIELNELAEELSEVEA